LSFIEEKEYEIENKCKNTCHLVLSGSHDIGKFNHGIR
jgi:hypothetical protein